MAMGPCPLKGASTLTWERGGDALHGWRSSLVLAAHGRGEPHGLCHALAVVMLFVRAYQAL